MRSRHLALPIATFPCIKNFYFFINVHNFFFLLKIHILTIFTLNK